MGEQLINFLNNAEMRILSLREFAVLLEWEKTKSFEWYIKRDIGYTLRKC